MALSNEQWNAPPAGGDFYEHQIANSCRFIGSANDDGTNFMYHARGTPTNADICTISAWVKRSKLGGKNLMFTGAGSGSVYGWYGFNTANEFWHLQAGDQPRLESNAYFRDTSAWYHIVIAQDTTQGTAANRNKVYINGVQYTDWGDFEDYSTQNADLAINTSGARLFVGSGGASANNSFYPFDGYIAEYVFIDGLQLTPSSFGETKNGAWIPKDPSGLTFGDNGAYLKFENSAALGNDSSGNDNDFTVTGVAAHDQMTDTPTFNSSSNGGNFPTFNRLQKTLTGAAISEGNLVLSQTGNNLGGSCNFEVPTGAKWYWEAYVVAAANQEIAVGITGPDTNLSGDGRGGSTNASTYAISFSQYSGSNYHARKFIAGSEADADGSQGTTGNAVLGIAINRVDNEVKFYWNNENLVTADISATAQFFPWAGQGGASGTTTNCTLNFGQEGTFAGAKTAGGEVDGNGYGNFIYAPPSNFLALCSGNLAVAEKVDPAQTDDDFPQKLFRPILYTGTDADIDVPVGFQPDWVWLKNRGATYNHYLFDSNRGVTKILRADTNAQEATTAESLKAFLSTGFRYGDDATGNEGSAAMVSWNWRANGGTTSTNTTGSVNVTQQVDPSGSFSISTYAGAGGTGTIGHGLSSAPTMVWVKQRNGANNWAVYAKGAGNTHYAYLDTDAAFGDAVMFQDTTPSSTLVYLGDNNEVNHANRTYVAYCFADTEGYIKSGAYEGNGNVDGVYVYTGFSPAFVICKSADSTSDWQIFDNEREGYNVDNDALIANDTTVEATADNIDLLSNGFKFRVATDPNVAETYVYLAFAHNPFKYATAR